MAGIPVGPGEDGDLDWTGEVHELEDRLEWMNRWQNEDIFVCSMSDLFHPRVSTRFIAKAFLRMINCDRGNRYLILTKIPQRFPKLIKESEFIEILGGVWGEDFAPPENIRFGTSIGVPASLWRLKYLAAIPTPYRYISIGPYLEDFEIPEQFAPLLSQIIVEGESASRDKSRPMHPAWVYRKLSWCQVHEVPFHFKQWGNWFTEEPEHIDPKKVEEFWGQRFYYRPKRSMSNLIDGQVYQEPMRRVPFFP